MINKIGIQNFRVFKEYTEFEIRPITLLVGPNNAGKSSFTKLLLLLKNGVSKLDFEQGLHNLESFDKVLNWETEQKALKIRFDNKLEFLDKTFFFDALYRNFGSESKMFSFKITNEKENLLSFYPAADKATKSLSYILNFNIELMMSLIYDDATTSFSRIDDNREFIGWIDDELGGAEFKHVNYEGDLSLENFNTIFKDTDMMGFDEQKPMNQVILKHEISKLERNYLLYDIFIKGVEATKLYKEEMKAQQVLKFSNIETSFGENLFLSFDNILLTANDKIKYQIHNYFSELLGEVDIEIKETRLGRILFTEKLFEGDNISVNNEINFKKTFFQQFSNFSKGLNEDFKTIEYISANRGSQKRILNNKSENDIDQIVLDFIKSSDKNIFYLELIFKILEIPGKLVVERFENVISVVYLVINDKKVALSDVGFGYSQLIPIILKLVTLTAYGSSSQMETETEWKDKRYIRNFFSVSSKIVIIEEPEANLHPSLQSKLADMFIATINYYPELNFIIETHSEYFIRKLQFLTAKKEIETDKSIIYYFNADKYVTANEPKVKPIEIRANGNLSDTFGPGFYDETSRLQFDLLKLNQEQNN